MPPALPSPLADAVMWAADGWTCARHTHTGTYLDWFCQPIFIKRCRGIFSCYASLLWNGEALKCLTALSSLLRPPHPPPRISPHPSTSPLLPPSHSFSGSELQRCLPLAPLAKGNTAAPRGGSSASIGVLLRRPPSR